jgi:hypothetical protein
MRNPRLLAAILLVTGCSATGWACGGATGPEDAFALTDGLYGFVRGYRMDSDLRFANREFVSVVIDKESGVVKVRYRVVEGELEEVWKIESTVVGDPPFPW